LGGFGQTAVTNQGNFLTQGANAQAAGQIGRTNAITGGINNLTTSLLSSPTGQNSNINNALNYIFANQGNFAGTGLSAGDLSAVAGDPNLSLAGYYGAGGP
jgi:hypothetical protein